MSTLDFVSSVLAAEGVDVEVRVVLDAPLWIDMAPYDSSVVSLAEQTRLVYASANVDGRVTETCRAAHPGEEWKCIFGEYRLPFVTTQYIVSTAQRDTFQISWNMGTPSAALTHGRPIRQTTRSAFKAA
mmetsp:Transcript_1299/g.4580  ORF Transcript_1299/g.4580 Transcript_1299/m.4580 type:complete len:129 (-) Transcript_1299:755-1141(-)